MGLGQKGGLSKRLTPWTKDYKSTEHPLNFDNLTTSKHRVVTD